MSLCHDVIICCETKDIHGLPSKKVMLFAKFLFSYVAVSDFFRIFALANSRRADSHGMPERL